MTPEYCRLVIFAFAVRGGSLLLSTGAGAGVPTGAPPLTAKMGPGPLILSCSTANFVGATNFGTGTSRYSVAAGDSPRRQFALHPGALTSCHAGERDYRLA